MCNPPIPSIVGIDNSSGPDARSTGFAPSERARLKAYCASATRNAIAGADGPCASAKRAAKEPGSALRIRLIPPWRYSVTALERWRATGAKPIVSNSWPRAAGSGWQNSTNSNPSVPIGLSGVMAGGGASCGKGPMAVGLNLAAGQTVVSQCVASGGQRCDVQRQRTPPTRPSLELGSRARRQSQHARRSGGRTATGYPSGDAQFCRGKAVGHAVRFWTIYAGKRSFCLRPKEEVPHLTRAVPLCACFLDNARYPAAALKRLNAVTWKRGMWGQFEGGHLPSAPALCAPPTRSSRRREAPEVPSLGETRETRAPSLIVGSASI